MSQKCETYLRKGGVSVNTEKLKKAIYKNCMSIENVAREIGVSRGTFYRKLNANGISFTVGEMNKMRALLKLTNRETECIFFD